MVKTSSQRKNQATFLLTIDFAEDELLGEFALETFDKNSGSEPRAFSFAIPAATMTVGLLPEKNLKKIPDEPLSTIGSPHLQERCFKSWRETIFCLQTESSFGKWEFNKCLINVARLAQSVERWTFNPTVKGSNSLSGVYFSFSVPYFRFMVWKLTDITS